MQSYLPHPIHLWNMEDSLFDIGKSQENNESSELWVLQGKQTPREYSEEPTLYEIPSCDIRCVRCHLPPDHALFPLRRVCSVVSLPDLTAIRNTASSVMLTTRRVRRALSLTSISSYQLDETVEGLTISSSSTASSFFHCKEEMKEAPSDDVVVPGKQFSTT